MIKGQNIICISSIDWDFIWQGHQEIVSTLAKNGNRVLFVENTGVRTPGIRDIPRIKKRVKNWLKGVKGVRREAENLYIFSPLVLPFPYSRFARWINRHLILSVLEKWMRIMSFSDPIVWTFLPTPLSVDIINNLIKKLLIYYCIDDFSVSSATVKKIKAPEERLLKIADLVFVTSKTLHNHCAKYNNKVYTFPFAVDFNEFESVRLSDNYATEELGNIEKPIIGYVGGIHKWIDQKLVRASVERHPEYSFVFVGPLQTDVTLLSGFKNVHFLGNKDHEKLPFFIKEFDVCIIPYSLTDYTKSVYPTKLNEYLAMSKAVVSTNLPEVAAFNKEYGDIVYVSGDEESFGKYIEKSLSEDSPDLMNRRIAAARENNWENRIEGMSSLIEKEIEGKMLDRETKWKENLLVFYRSARRRVMRLGAICLLLLFVLFKTPFIWLLASPLKISEVPRRADAIVVFGGGVGETGSPGKSTIERARYAAELYQAGFANKVVFSSGYAYTYSDAENMRLIALSTGVQAKDITLEGRAASTYENVVFTKEILDSNKWNSILLVSSPYNMRRASLVFNKWGDDIKVFYTPVSKCQFYNRVQGVRLEQIRAIMHEYLGIAYYLFKGYI